MQKPAPLFAALLAVTTIVAVLMAAPDKTNHPGVKLPKPSTTIVSAAPAAAVTDALPQTNAPAPRLPVYVIPDCQIVQLPSGHQFHFVDEAHVRELSRKFFSVHVTNLVIYSDGM